MREYDKFDEMEWGEIGAEARRPGDLRMSPTELSWCRMCDWPENDIDWWKHGRIEIKNHGMCIMLVGVTSDDLGTLIEFLTECKRRLDSY